MSLEPGQDLDEQPEGNYLFWSLLGTGLVVAIGCSAMLGKLEERPELAAADPLLVSVLKGARLMACIGLGAMAALLALQYLRPNKN